MDLTAIRQAVASTLEDRIDGLRAFAYAPDQVPAGPSAAVLVLPGDGEYVRYVVTSRGGAIEIDLRLQVIVQHSDARSAEEALDRLLSSGTGHDASLVDAILADRRLGGLVADCTPSVARQVGTYTVGDVAYLGAVLDLLVLSDRL